MKTILIRNQLNSLAKPTLAAILASSLFCADKLQGEPRSPLPPVPEQTPLYRETFDEGYFPGETNTILTIPYFGIYDQSWSGYALVRSGEVLPFIIPALTSDGYTNITSDTGGALRLWLNPSWTSQSLTGGSGPGSVATVMEFDAVSGGDSALAWSLQITADGNTLQLVTSSGTALETSIAWQAGQPHLLTVDYMSPGG